MRPPAGVEAALDRPTVRSRKSSATDLTPTPGTCPTGPTSFFLRSEEELDNKAEDSSTKIKHSSYGVQSLEETLEDAFGDKSGHADEHSNEGSRDVRELKKVRKSSINSTRSSPRSKRSPRAKPTRDFQLPPAGGKSSPHILAHLHRASNDTNLLTALRIESPASHFAIPGTPKSSSMKSLRLSDDDSLADDAASQAIMSSDEEEEQDEHHSTQHSENISGSMPQLVMPSIQMPKRKPFTPRGKEMGRLKVLVTGFRGTGKTSLIKSLIQLCEDIVHVDPPVPYSPMSSKQATDGRRKSSSSRQKVSSIITETFASTKTYPSWWSESLESQMLQRRKSMSDSVLERNLCFIDTPGLDDGAEDEIRERIVSYMEESYVRSTSVAAAASISETLATLSGGGGTQVDLLLFVFSHRLDMDMQLREFLCLSEITNVLPLIGHADTLETSEVDAMKSKLAHCFKCSGQSILRFVKSTKEIAARSLERDNAAEDNNEQRDSHGSYTPFAISCRTSPDTDNMDASLLMSSDYIQPLLQSDLSALVTQLFDPENMAWLRHLSAKKLIQWHKRNIPNIRPTVPYSAATSPYESTNTIQTPFSGRHIGRRSATSSLLSSPRPSEVLVPHGSSPFYSYPESISGAPTDHSASPFTSNFALTRFQHTAAEEERISRISMARWATDLQRSLRNERERFDLLEHGKRAQWQLERIGDEAHNGRVLPAALTGRPMSSASSSRAGSYSKSPPKDAEWAVVRHGKSNLRDRDVNWAGISLDPRDPLGLCEIGDGVMRGGMVVFGVGVVGAVCWAVVRWAGDGGQADWAWIWGGERI